MRLSLLFARVCPCGLLEKLGWDRIAETPVTPAHARQHQGEAAPSSSSHVQEYVAFVPLAGNSAPYAGKSCDLLSFWRVPRAAPAAHERHWQAHFRGMSLCALERGLDLERECKP